MERTHPTQYYTAAWYGANIAYAYDWINGEGLIFVILGTVSREFWVYNTVKGTWERLADVPVPLHRAAALETGYSPRTDRSFIGVYLLPADATGSTPGTFWRYDYEIIPRLQGPGPNSGWVQLLSYGPSEDNDSICELTYSTKDTSMYAYLGARLYKQYKIKTKEWISREAFDPPPSRGCALATLGVVGIERIPHYDTLIYLLRGCKTNDFCDYRLSKETWRSTPADPPRWKVYFSSDLAFGRLKKGEEVKVGMWAFPEWYSREFGFFWPYGSDIESGGQGSSSESKNPIKIFQRREKKCVKFKSPNSSFRLEIYDNLGKLIYQTDVPKEALWNYGELGSGIYYYRIRGEHLWQNGKLVIQK